MKYFVYIPIGFIWFKKYENDLIFSLRFGEDASKRSTATKQEQAKPSEAASTDTKSSKNSASDTDTSQTAEAKSSTEAAAAKETAAPAATNNEMPVPKIKVTICFVRDVWGDEEYNSTALFSSNSLSS